MLNEITFEEKQEVVLPIECEKFSSFIENYYKDKIPKSSVATN